MSLREPDQVRTVFAIFYRLLVSLGILALSWWNSQVRGFCCRHFVRPDFCLWMISGIIWSIDMGAFRVSLWTARSGRSTGYIRVNLLNFGCIELTNTY